MDKDLLNKLLPYCGYEFKATEGYEIYDVCLSSSGKKHKSIKHLIHSGREGWTWKPILFSPDCLTKEIETEHGKEIPMIEMAKIAYESFKLSSTSIKEISLNDRGDVRLMNNNSVIYIFRCHIFYPWFIFEVETRHIPFNPLPILDYLYSRHIAFNLRPEEYVSVESLKNNPYAKNNVR